MNVIITSPFRTATPESAMNPTAAEIEKGISLSHRPANPPVKARGTPVKTINAYLAGAKSAKQKGKNKKKRHRNYYLQTFSG